MISSSHSSKKDLLDGSHTHIEEEEEKEEEEEEEVKHKVKAEDVAEEISKWKKIGSFLWRVWLEVVDYIINFLEDSSANYIEVLKRVAKARRESTYDRDAPPTGDDSPHAEEGRGLEETGAKAPGITVQAEITESRATPPVSETKFTQSSPVRKSPSFAAPPSMKRMRSSGYNFDRSDDIIQTLRIAPSSDHEEQAKAVHERLEKLSTEYSRRPKRLLHALYYWTLSHFSYVVIFMAILAIIRSGSFISFFYVAIVFMWGLLYVPWPTKRYWNTLLFFTMFVLVGKYVFYFIYFAIGNDGETGDNAFLGLNGPASWFFGIKTTSSYFSNSFVHLLLLMSIIFHRGLLKVGICHNDVYFSIPNSNMAYGITFQPLAKTQVYCKCITFYYLYSYCFTCRRSVFHSFIGFFKTLFSKTTIAGAKDFYNWMLFFDCLCFITIAVGYSSFSVSEREREYIYTFIRVWVKAFEHKK